MNKSLLIPIIGAFALSMLTSCGAEKKPTEKTVESTLDEVIANKSNLDHHTKYHVSGVRPYSFHRGDGSSYPASNYYFFARGTTDSTYISALTCITGVTEHTEKGFKFNIDSIDVASKVEKNLIGQGANTNCTYDVNFYYVQFTSYMNVAVEILSFTPVVE